MKFNEYIPYEAMGCEAELLSIGVDDRTCKNGLGTTNLAERAWVEARRPFYRVWPEWVAMLLRSPLNIPGRVFNSPHPFFAIHLPDMEFLNFGKPLKSILVGVSQKAKEDGSYLIEAICDVGDRQRSMVMLEVMSDNESISKTVDSIVFDDVPNWSQDSLRSMTSTAVQLVLSVGLLAVSAHRSVECEVLAALRDRYRESTDDRERSAIVEKSKRRGVYGWSIGRDLKLYTPTAHASDATGNELTYQHIRGGHWHTVLHGPGREKRKAVFFVPTIVRPDLPPKPLAPSLVVCV